MTKVAVSTGNNTGLPTGTELEIFPFADAGLGTYGAIVDPANPTRALTPAADGSIVVTGPLTNTQLLAATVAVTASLGVAAAAEITRPANATPYTFGDAISDNATAYMTLAGVTRVASSVGYISGIQLETDLRTSTQQVRVHLFSAAPTAIADNAPFTMLYANKAIALGFIDLPAFQSGPDNGSTSARTFLNDGLRFRIVSDASGSPSIYGLLEDRSASTPANTQKYYLSITMEKN
jgi:hypothetical protein